MKPGITFGEMFDVIDARIELMEKSMVLWSWRVQGASEANLRDVEKSVGKALDRLWEAQQRAA